MTNPFKKRYKISETKTPTETYYWVQYGSLWSHTYLDRDGCECGFWGSAEIWGGKFTSVEIAKKVIEKHALSKIDKRLSKPITKTIQYV